MVTMGIQKPRNQPAVWQDIRPAQPAHRMPVRPISKKKKIKLSFLALFKLPIFTKTSKKLASVHRKKLIISCILCIISILAVAYYNLPKQPTKTINGSGQVTMTPKLVKGIPDYPTVIPTGKTIDSLGGWTRVSPPSSNAVFAYSDKIGTVRVSVSEQPLPNDFKTDTAQKTDQLARDFNATEKITIGSTIVHIGTSKDGPQSVIFTTNKLLILIKSATKIDDNQWATYINSLQ